MKSLRNLIGVLLVMAVFSGVSSAIPYTFEFSLQEIKDAIDPTLSLEDNGIYRLWITTDDISYSVNGTVLSLAGADEWIRLRRLDPARVGLADDPTDAQLFLLTDNPNAPYTVAGDAIWTVNIDSASIITGAIEWDITVYGTPLAADGSDGGADFSNLGGFSIRKLPEQFQGLNSPPPIPEPATLTLCGAGLAGILIAARRKRQS